MHDPKGLSNLTQLKVCPSKSNLHKVKNNFKDTLNPMCATNDGIKDTENFLLWSFGNITSIQTYQSFK